ncbi:nitrate reductase [Paraconexibacter algicola]|uniref:nitrate reductase n=1 Tax=Paraconexibacter algicola TaxID=2133960 RepID=UPI001304C5B7|nr:nitrate reductase [Paraconexibacter algicola]
MSLPAPPPATRTREVRTACPYCGTGCGLVAEVAGGRVQAVKGDPLHPVNRGATCRKPLRLPDALTAADRATTPLWRDALDARWRPRTWRQTAGELARRLQDVTRRHGPDAIALYLSGQMLTEDYYAASKLAKGFLGTNNVDSNSRLCMSSAVAGYTGALGSDGPPASYADLDQADHVLVLGSNTSACHPIVWSRIRRRRQEGATVTVIDPRATPTAQQADLHLAVRPGADLPLLSAMLHVLEGEGLLDEAFLSRHTEGAEEALAAAREWTPGRAAEVCGLDAEEIVRAARMFGGARRAMALWSMGANQSTVGTLKNRALINLCLATGNIGRPGTGPFSLTGQPNAMGGRESGGLAHLLPGYRLVTDPEHRAEMRRLWDLPADLPGISPAPGIPATELVEALEDDRVKIVWIIATNPAVSQPDAARFAAALRRAELVVVQDAYHPTETGALAHVVLPAAQWGEKDGTQTNSERRVSLVRKLVDPPGDALPDWEIFARVGRALGHPDAFGWRTAADVHAEYVTATAGRLCDQTGLSHERLRREGPLQWPVPARGVDGEDHAGTERLYTGRRFPTPTGRARLAPTPHAEPADRPGPEHPLVLTTGRVAHQWHTMTRTGKAKDLLAAEPEPFVELHPDDAATAGVADGELVLVRSPRGRATMRARVTDTVLPGVAFAPFHWGALHLPPGAGALNGVVARAIDPVSKQAELKASAVRIEPLGADRTAAAASADDPGARPRRLVVVGGGMAGMATVEAALANVPAGAPGFDVTIIGAESVAPYNRVLLSTYLAGGVGEHELALRHPDWLAARGVTLRLGVPARHVDTAARVVELADGDTVPYDDLVLATGSRPFVPPVRGADSGGVHVFRTTADAGAILERAARPEVRRAVVIGGGLLGLEAARALTERGLRVTVVHLADRLMEQQLDGPAASLLTRALAALRITVRVGARTQAIVPDEDGHVRAVALEGGEELPADLVVIAAGIRPDVDLARTAGLELDRGVLVDDELRTSAPGVRAVGECAEHRGHVYGLWAPLLDQARAAGASLAGQPAAFQGALPATTLKVAGIELFCCGRVLEEDGDEEVLALDTRQGRYRRLLLRDGRLEGAILLGDLRDARALRELLRDRGEVPASLLDGPAASANADAALAGAVDPAMNVCSCQGVTHGEIEHAIRDRGLTSVDQVAEHTRASTGCGGCRPDVAEILARLRSRAATPA